MIKLTMEKLKVQLDQIFSPFLNPPASEEEIQRVENEMAVKFPDEIRELYLIHNGEREDGPGLFFGLPFLPLNDVLQEWHVWKQLEDEFAMTGSSYSVPTGYIKERYINRFWIPISKDFGGNNIGIDVDPDYQGQIGQVINFGRDEEVKYVIATQLSDFLEFIAETIFQGNYQIEQEEDDLYWNYKNSTHFLDTLKTLELPVLHHESQTFKEETAKWMQDLDSGWKEIIQEEYSNPENFIKRKQLYLIGKKLTHIKPLQFCTEVKELILTSNELTDITPLKNMLSLKKLYLVKNPLSDLTPLQNLEHLQELNINDTQVFDITPLVSISQLKNLEMDQTDVKDFSILQQCQALESLSISIVNKEQLRQITQISNLKQLGIHQLKNIEEVDLLQLDHLENLQVITFENCYLKNLDCLSSSRQLRQIILKNTVLEDGTAIGALKNLKCLKLDGTTIENLKVIAKSSSLQIFTGSFEQFNYLKDLFHQAIDFSTIVGGMTAEEQKVWHQYLNTHKV
ncbi:MULTISPECIES: SMI1/KNR4 family protein [Lysinibacillus]|uniref:SMI1/KNR4 family protein n=1 Tax=Lysinibacillus TaxID=400634 RepID=UPI00257BB428|nr:MULTISPECIES: SMI1/KNR4 family protein [Lysinibacillus]